MKSLRPLSERSNPKLRNTAYVHIRDLDPDLHGLFKAECARRGRTMRGMWVAILQDLGRPEEKRVVNWTRLSSRYKEVR